MRILYIATVLDTEPYSIFFVNALRELGHEVIAFDIRNFCEFNFAMDYKHLNEIAYSISMQNQMLNSGYKIIHNLINSNDINIMIAQGGKELHPKFLDEIEIPKVWLYGDLGYEHTGKYLAPHYDLVLHTENVEKYKEICNIVDFNMISVFPIHKPDLAEDKIYDVTFIGSPYQFRVNFIMALAEILPYKIHLFGKGWRITHRNVVCYGEVFGEEMVKVINQSKVILHIQHPNVQKATLRFYEVMGCSGVLLTDYIPEKFKPYKLGLFCYKNVEDCKAKIINLISREAWKSALVKNTSYTIHKKYGVKATCARMIEIIKKEFDINEI